MQITYSWKPGAHQTANAQVAGQVMQNLSETKGLNAENLVEISRPEDAPLHNSFEWNDTKAAQEWRKQQARVMIAAITVEDLQGSPQPVRAFFTVGEKQDYKPIQVIVNSESDTDKLLKQAYKEMQSFIDKYNTLSLISSVTATMRAALQEVGVPT